MTFTMKKRIWKFNVNLLQSSTFTHSDVMKKEVKRNKAIHHLITKKICDPNTPFYWYISYFLIAGKKSHYNACILYTEKTINNTISLKIGKPTLYFSSPCRRTKMIISCSLYVLLKEENTGKTVSIALWEVKILT